MNFTLHLASTACETCELNWPKRPAVQCSENNSLSAPTPGGSDLIKSQMQQSKLAVQLAMRTSGQAAVTLCVDGQQGFYCKHGGQFEAL